MLLRYVALGHPFPDTEQKWAEFALWKRTQLELPECRMAEGDGEAGEVCQTCPGHPGCPKGRTGA